MLRAFSKPLFFSLIVCHTAVTVCGPCLHDLAGSTHRAGVSLDSSTPGDVPQSRDHNADNCLVCHYVAQAQLSVDLVCFAVVPLTCELETPKQPVLPSSPTRTLAHPRAPPAAIS
jgi:hypothetical protein